MVHVDINELLAENHALREKLKEVISDRDRLLCELTNLRLELDMAELKRTPEDSFPQKSIERSGSVQYGIAGSNTSGSESGGYVYLQQNCTPLTLSSNSSGSAVYLTNNAQQPNLIFQQSTQQYHPAYYQQPMPENSRLGGGMAFIKNVGGYEHDHKSHHHMHNHHHHHHQHQYQHQHPHQHQHQHQHHCHGRVLVAPDGGTTGGTFHKKNSIRNSGDMMKRSRMQSVYELSQDLLDKQIELLERKYGGVRARNAAVTIQRAFRHYMMVKKFASITAMAKAEKRNSRRALIVGGRDEAIAVSSSSSYENVNKPRTDGNEAGILGKNSPQYYQHQPRVTILAGPAGATATHHTASGSRTPPTRSLSMRERRHVDLTTMSRNQSGVVNNSPVLCPSSIVVSTATSNHPHVNLLHVAEPQYFGNSQVPVLCGSYNSLNQDASFSSCSVGNSYLDSSLNASWVTASSSPHTPYYSAAQIYMRPRGTSTSQERKKIPPEVPKRTSSITVQQQHAMQQQQQSLPPSQQQQQQQQQQIMVLRQTPPPATLLRSNGLNKTSENGSLISVQSSGSESSAISLERNVISDLASERSNSPNTCKHATTNMANAASFQQFTYTSDPSFANTPNINNTLNVAVGTTGTVCTTEENALPSLPPNTVHFEQQQEQQQLQQEGHHQLPNANYKISETLRKRQYRVGLNLFNKRPEKGISYLIRRGFLENTPQGVARFLITRKGLSRQMIGEYLGNLQNTFNMAVLNCFAMELDLSGMQVDVALRKFQAYFRMPGEAQKIERLMEVFSQRYCQCNQDVVGRLRSADTIFVLAFAIIMLNTDLHTPNLKPERRMRVEDFIKNLRGIDDCHDIDKDMLAGIYERVKGNEFKPGSDHVSQIMKVQATIVGKKPNLALPHRRLVCYCRLYEIPDINKKERPGVHQREVFLFNDLLVITKIFSKKKSTVTYTFRNSFPLYGMVVSLLDVPNYPFCIQLSQKVDGKILFTFNARNEHDRCKFAEDLKESISEMDEMEALRIEAELERQKSARTRTNNTSENRDSGVADIEVCPCPFQSPQKNEMPPNALDAAQLKRSALSNSLLDIHEQFGNDKPQRRGSVGSLDSGMSISFQSTTTSNASRDNAAAIAAAVNTATTKLRLVSAPSSLAGTYVSACMQPISNVNVISEPFQQQQQQHVHMQHAIQYHPHHQHQQSSVTINAARANLENKYSPRSEENGRSTEV